MRKVIIVLSVSLVLGLFVILTVVYTSNQGKNQDSNTNESISDIIEIIVTDNLKIFDGRSGESFDVDQNDYLMKINTLVKELVVTDIEEYDGATGSSYNLMYYDNSGDLISVISLGWREDKVLIEGSYYTFQAEQLDILYSYIEDIFALETSVDKENVN